MHLRTAIGVVGLAVSAVAGASWADDIQSLKGEWIKTNGPSRPDQPGIGAYLEFQPQSSRVVLSWSAPAKISAAGGKYGADLVLNNELHSCWYAVTRTGTKLVLRLVRGDPPGVCLEDSIFEQRQPLDAAPAMPPRQQVLAPPPGAGAGRSHLPAPTGGAAVCANSPEARYCTSSILPTVGINVAHYGPRNLFDRDDSTAWVENVEGDGIGEWLVISWTSPRILAGMRITNGYAKSQSLFSSNGRVRRLEVAFSSGEPIVVVLQDTINNQLIRFNRPVEAAWMKLTILEAIRGKKYRDTAISELQPIFE